MGLRDIWDWGHWGCGDIWDWRHGAMGIFGLEVLGAWGHGGWGPRDVLQLRAMSPCPRSGCFRTYFVHKFRATLGKNRVVFPGEKVQGDTTCMDGDPGGGTRAADYTSRPQWWHQGC